MKFNGVGPIRGSGLGNAYDMHTEALGVFHRVDCSDFRSPIFAHENTYYHGMPRRSEAVNTSGRNIAYWVCESSKLTEDYHKNHHRFTDIWTASTYCQQILETELNRKVKVVPHCVRRFTFQERVSDRLAVLIVFDGNSRFVRKNPVAAIAAVKDAFGRDCQLIVKGRNVKSTLLQWMRKEAEGLDAVFLTDDFSLADLQRIYSATDILLSLHTSEGFGLNLLEAMGYGKKVVATAWGGNVDYMNDKNSFLVEAKEVDVNDDYFKGTWGQPSHEHAVEQLRAAAQADNTINKAAFQTALQYSFTNTISATHVAL